MPASLVFAAVDHRNAACVGIHAIKLASRFEAREPLRHGVREHFGAFGPQAAAGLRIRHDHGFVHELEGNGGIERFLRTLNKQLLWVRHFQDIEELQPALREFRDRCNRKWLIERLGFQSPRQARERFLALPQAARLWGDCCPRNRGRDTCQGAVRSWGWNCG